MSVLLDSSTARPTLAEQRAVGDRLRPLLPAAGLLLRDVRAGRPDPQLARPVRPDDVGADRQQRDRDRRAGRLPGRRSARRPTPSRSARSRTDQELLLGLGSTVGIVAQLLILIPYLRAVGYRYRPRFDFRHTGLGHTFRLGVWTVLFVIVNQAAYVVVVRLASGGTAGRRRRHRHHDLLRRVPDRDGAALDHHGLAGHRDPAAALGAGRRQRPRRRWRAPWSSTLRTALVGDRPVRGAAAGDRRPTSPTCSGDTGPAPTSTTASCRPCRCSAAACVFFTVHYLMLRGFYALEPTRTVFWIQCGVAATNIVVAVVLVGQRRRRGHLTGAGARLHRGVRRRLGAVVRRAPRAGSAGWARPGPLSASCGRLVIAVAASTAAALGVAVALALLDRATHTGWCPPASPP